MEICHSESLSSISLFPCISFSIELESGSNICLFVRGDPMHYHTISTKLSQEVGWTKANNQTPPFLQILFGSRDGCVLKSIFQNYFLFFTPRLIELLREFQTFILLGILFGTFDSNSTV